MALTKVSKELFNTDTVFAVDSIGGKYGSSSSPISIAVTVGTKTAAHPYNGDGSSSAYFLDGIEAPALQLNGADNVTSDSGYYYRFDQSDSTNSSHPLRFYLDADKTTAYTTGVTTNGTAGSAGAYTQIDVDEDTPSILYYQCSSHEYMGNYALVPASNVINHTEALISMPTATTTLVGTDTTDTLTNKTLTTPTVTTPVVNAGLQLKNGATSAGFIEFFEDSDNGTNKVTLIGPAATADVTITLPDSADTLVGKATTDTLTNKTLTTPVINAGAQLKNGATSAGFLEFFEDSDNGTNKVTLIGPASTADITLTLPSSDGDANQFLQTNGSGVLSFASAGGAYNSWLIKTSAYTALVGDQIIVNSASAVTITLPASASAGNTVIIKATGGGTVTIGRNSQNINSAAADSTLFNGNAVQLVYVDGTIGFLEI